jgi:hypothetical protein
MLIENRRLRIKDKQLITDTKITITVETDEEYINRINGKEPLFEQSILGNKNIQNPDDTDDMVYKGYRIKQDSNGEFDIYAPGGSIVNHVASIELAQSFIDNADIKETGDADTLYDIIKKQGKYWISKAGKFIGYFLTEQLAQKAIKEKDFSLIRDPSSLLFINDKNKNSK